jgi:hypothetical protein
MHYSIRDQIRTVDDLRAYFPEPVADEMNFCLFSTSGVHGSYTTIEQAELATEDYGNEVTVLVVQPRRVMLAYGNVTVTPETAPYLKALRASSLAAVARIGLPDAPTEDDGEADDAWTGGFSENH